MLWFFRVAQFVLITIVFRDITPASSGVLSTTLAVISEDVKHKKDLVYCRNETTTGCFRTVMAYQNTDVSLTCTAEHRVNFCRLHPLDGVRTVVSVAWFYNGVPVSHLRGKPRLLLEQHNTTLTITVDQIREAGGNYSCVLTRYRRDFSQNCSNCSMTFDEQQNADCLKQLSNGTGEFLVVVDKTKRSPRLDWLRSAIYFGKNQKKADKTAPAIISCRGIPRKVISLESYETFPDSRGRYPASQQTLHIGVDVPHPEIKYGLGLPLTLRPGANYTFECPVLDGIPLGQVLWFLTSEDRLDMEFAHRDALEELLFQREHFTAQVNSRWTLNISGLRNDKYSRFGIHCLAQNDVKRKAHVYSFFSWLIEAPKNHSEKVRFNDREASEYLILDSAFVSIVADIEGDNETSRRVYANVCNNVSIKLFDNFSFGRWMLDLQHLENISSQANLSELVSESKGRGVSSYAHMLELNDVEGRVCMDEHGEWTVKFSEGWWMWKMWRMREGAGDCTTVAFQWLSTPKTDETTAEPELSSRVTPNLISEDIKLVWIFLATFSSLLLIGAGALYVGKRIRGARAAELKAVEHANSPEQTRLVSLMDEWHIEEDLLECEAIIGEGEFGVVRRGFIKEEAGTRLTVAIKHVKDGKDERQNSDLESELDVLKKIGRNSHPNLISFIGYCVKDGWLCVVTELASLGNLLSHLHQMHTEVSSGSLQHGLATLYQFIHQIACGMAYLSAKSIVHSDLAARNILVGSDLILKISDFGLTRFLNDSEYYQKRTAGILPIKWLSPELLTDRLYSTKSDIWSFGVLVWEVFSLGGKPYPDYSLPDMYDTFMLKLLRGCRLACPRNMPPDLYRLLLQCWERKPAQRPPFSALRERILFLADNLTDMPLVPPASNRKEGKLVPVVRSTWLGIGTASSRRAPPVPPMSSDCESPAYTGSVSCSTTLTEISFSLSSPRSPTFTSHAPLHGAGALMSNWTDGATSSSAFVSGSSAQRGGTCDESPEAFVSDNSAQVNTGCDVNPVSFVSGNSAQINTECDVNPEGFVSGNSAQVNTGCDVNPEVFVSGDSAQAGIAWNENSEGLVGGDHVGDIQSSLHSSSGRGNSTDVSAGVRAEGGPIASSSGDDVASSGATTSYIPLSSCASGLSTQSVTEPTALSEYLSML